MSQNNRSSLQRTMLASLLAVVVACASLTHAQRPGWVEKKVNIRMNSRTTIKSIRYPKDHAPRTFSEYKALKLRKARDKSLAPTVRGSTALAVANIIDSPPVDGFVPWVVVIATDERAGELELEAAPQTSVVGNFPGGYNPQTKYAIGIYDTGASAHVMGYENASQLGLFAGFPDDLVSDNPIAITGVTGHVTASVSMPLGLFIDGLNALDSGNSFTDTSGVVGQTNVSIIVGRPVTPPTSDLPTAIGSPIAVYFTAVMKNDQQVTIFRDGTEFTAPSINFYEAGDPAIPTWSKTIPLELRPLGGLSVQYAPFINFYDIFEDIFNLDFHTPQTPSTIIGQQAQSVFFVHSVDLSDNGRTAADKNRFLFDTGAQVTVIGSRIGARLGLDPENPDFEVKIQGITGHIEYKPGYFLDSLQIPALGGWLQFTNTPVVLLDVFSPEGGTVDGIIGTNLFVDFNLVLRGGGLFLQEDPSLQLEPIEYVLTGDVAPPNGDGVVNYYDLSVFSQAWLSDPNSGNWNAGCDIAPLYGRDNKVNSIDFALLARHWLEGANP